MKGLPHKIETITFDKGKEFATHKEISIALTRIFHNRFCCGLRTPDGYCVSLELLLGQYETYSRRQNTRLR